MCCRYKPTKKYYALFLLIIAVLILSTGSIRTLPPNSQCKRAYGSLLLNNPPLGIEQQLKHMRSYTQTHEDENVPNRRLSMNRRRKGRRRNKRKARVSPDVVEQTHDITHNLPPALAARAGATPPQKRFDDAKHWHDAMNHFLHQVRPIGSSSKTNQDSSKISQPIRRNDHWRRDGHFRNSLRQEDFASVFNFSPLLMGNASLQMINVGFGSTGVGAVYDIIVSKYQPSCRGIQCTDEHVRNPLMEQYNILLSCIKKQVSGGRNNTKLQSSYLDCDTKRWMEQTKQALLSTVQSGVVSLHDVPVCFFYRELLDLVPGLRVVHSLRDPYEWTIRRVTQHQGDLMCKPNATIDSSSYGSKNIFHLLQCIEHSQSLSDNIMWVRDFMHLHEVGAGQQYINAASMPHDVAVSMEVVANAYADFNQMLLLNTLRKDNIYAPVCVWDNHIEEQL